MGKIHSRLFHSPFILTKHEKILVIYENIQESFFKKTSII